MPCPWTTTTNQKFTQIYGDEGHCVKSHVKSPDLIWGLCKRMLGKEQPSGKEEGAFPGACDP